MDCYNRHLETLDGKDDTWFTAAWLFAECYLYVPFILLFHLHISHLPSLLLPFLPTPAIPPPSRHSSCLLPFLFPTLTYFPSPPLKRGRYRQIRTLFAKTTKWTQYDPFFTSKEETYKSSSTAMIRESALCLAQDVFFRLSLSARGFLADSWGGTGRSGEEFDGA